MAGDPSGFGKDTGSSWLPDPPYALFMIVISAVGLIAHLIIFT